MGERVDGVTATARRRGLLRRLPPFARSLDQVDRYRLAWEQANERALGLDGPLWVVLGDSAAQGVGAGTHDRGWVGQVLARLLVADPRPWRVVNLSRSGARTRDVVEQQWPLARELPAELITAVVGGNDALRTGAQQWRLDVDALCAALPPGAVVSTTARGVFERKTAGVNAHLRARAVEHDLRVADVSAHTGPPYRGLYADGFHPNEAGYAQWADAVAEALGL